MKRGFIFVTLLLLSFSAYGAQNNLKVDSYALLLTVKNATKTLFYDHMSDKTALTPRVKQFVLSNTNQLVIEIAQGHGESIDTLAELLDISDKSAFISLLQVNYKKVYLSQNLKFSQNFETY